jgi:hypothetical protein
LLVGLEGYLLEPDVAQLKEALKRLASRAPLPPKRMVVLYEAGHTGFWLARLLRQQGIEAHVLHPASVPVDRRARRAKTDRLDVALLLRSVLAWLRGRLQKRCFLRGMSGAFGCGVKAVVLSSGIGRRYRFGPAGCGSSLKPARSAR